MSDDVVLIDDPADGVRRITLNRPEKRNALNHALRGGIVRALVAGDPDPSVRVMIVRGTGRASPPATTSAAATRATSCPGYTAGGDGHWPRHVTDGWMSIWDLAKPVIAQVHGYCLAGGSELATGCDLVYVADDAKIGYPAVRFGVPDMHFHAWFARHAQGDGDDADRRLDLRHRGRRGSAGRTGRSRPTSSRSRCSRWPSASPLIPPDLVQLNKRVVHRQMEVMGLRTGIRVGTELCALGTHTQACTSSSPPRPAGTSPRRSQPRDEPFGDYRTIEREPAAN